MRAYIIGLILTICAGFLNVSFADDANLVPNSITSTINAPITLPPPGLALPENANPITYYKSMLLEYLNAGDIALDNFDKNTKIYIAQIQLELSKAYMQQGDRKLALILGILASKTMQSALGNPEDPEMIPIYSTLVQLYTSKVDNDYPGIDKSNANKAKEYRELIDRIHAQ